MKGEIRKPVNNYLVQAYRLESGAVMYCSDMTMRHLLLRWNHGSERE
jgi:hypothetical protein